MVRWRTRPRRPLEDERWLAAPAMDNGTSSAADLRTGPPRLGSVSNQQILARLVPDLFVLTIHPAYQSFYAFVLDEFWRRDDLKRSRAAWMRYYRAKELIFSIACNTCEHPDYEGDFANIVGSGSDESGSNAPQGRVSHRS